MKLVTWSARMQAALWCTASLACEPLSSGDTQRARAQSAPDAPTVATTEPQVMVPVQPGAGKNNEQVIPIAVRRANYAITKLHLDLASELLEGQVGPHAALTRARLAVYRADCEGADAHLTSEATRSLKEAAELVHLAPRCTRATVGGVVLEDKERGVWIRLQDDADRVLVPAITEVAAQALHTLEKDLGETLPRPLRIDLVRDLFSLSAVSGLPLEAAETTGTVAVARWGRVTMVSPRAISRGFPWADTMAHEITHLLISRATADRAPLWLQEGVAKREERRWREAYPFDDALDLSERAYDAQREGRSVGIDQLGPSIAMLPSAEHASIAFAEVTSFISYWIEQNGAHSLGLLLRDMEVAPDDDSALRSVSGYGVSDWQHLWRAELERRFASPPQSIEVDQELGAEHRQLSRNLRLIELLTVDGHPQAAADHAAAHLDQAAHVAAFRFLAARAAMLSRPELIDTALGSVDELDSAHAGWLSLRARRLSLAQSDAGAAQLLSQAKGLDPLLPEVACAGVPWVGKSLTQDAQNLPGGALLVDQELCEHARSLVVRGSR